jgi:hypothetical protein
MAPHFTAFPSEELRDHRSIGAITDCMGCTATEVGLNTEEDLDLLMVLMTNPFLFLSGEIG